MILCKYSRCFCFGPCIICVCMQTNWSQIAMATGSGRTEGLHRQFQGGSYRCPGGWEAGLERPREDLFEAPDRHPKEQQREQELGSFAAQKRWRFNKRNFEGQTVLVWAVGARAISGSFCSGKALPEIWRDIVEKRRCCFNQSNAFPQGQIRFASELGFRA